MNARIKHETLRGFQTSAAGLSPALGEKREICADASLALPCDGEKGASEHFSIFTVNPHQRARVQGRVAPGAGDY